VTRHHSCRVSPFGHPRIHARLTAPRGITQPPTSFIGSQCQGIHHAPLNTYNTKPKVIYNFEIAHQTPKSPHHPYRRHEHIRCLDARNHYPQIKHHTPPPKLGATTSPIPGFPHSGRRDSGPVVSKPNSVSGNSITGIQSLESRAGSTVCRAPEPHPLQARVHPSNRCDHRTPTQCGRAAVSWCSLERR
jgi:hypothetical protein